MRPWFSFNNSFFEQYYQDNADVIAFPNKILIKCINTLFSKNNFMDKFENVNLGRDSTTPLEHTFGRACVCAKDVHTIKKFISVNFSF